MLMSEKEAKVYEDDTGQLEEQTEEEGTKDVTVSLNAMCGSVGNSSLRVNGLVGTRRCIYLLTVAVPTVSMMRRLWEFLDAGWSLPHLWKLEWQMVVKS
ncbi:UNVERIFIED_CONTAM: hypothetical protein Slati_0407300 [Sesamum latifolium]|uniref:Uncharacterized protein n=1 Tax=Sesamum latifolium TaxID=2727402 RepID=A0AAW2XYI7_9LAMI